MRDGNGPSWTPAQTVLVLQGGGALGAYQAGVYQGLHEAGIEPDWVIGTSIGGINGAIIAGNEPQNRVKSLIEFWSRVGHQSLIDENWLTNAFLGLWGNFNTVAQGVPGFFKPNPSAIWGLHTPVGAEAASFYTTEPLRTTLKELVDFSLINAKRPRFTVGAVNIRSGDMTYFDSPNVEIGPDHIMASGALPPAFPAIPIDGELFWDGGIYSNTPVEVVLDDKPRRDSLIFSVNVWQPHGRAPDTIWQVLGRQKDIQYSSRVKSHVARQEQIHRLRHIVKELCARLPPEARQDPMVEEMAAYGCKTTMHLVRLLAPRLGNEDHTKDIDFSRAGIRTRWHHGYTDVQRMIAERAWDRPTDALEGIVVHESAPAGTGPKPMEVRHESEHFRNNPEFVGE